VERHRGGADLLQRFAHTSGASATRTGPPEDEPRHGARDGDEAFRIAAQYLSNDEIRASLQKWIKDDKSASSSRRREPGQLAYRHRDALERHQQLSLGDRDLSRTMQLAIRASLVRRFFTDDLDYINIAKHWVEVDDFHPLVQHIISLPGSHGKLGGKSSGLFLARRSCARPPSTRTWSATSAFRARGT